MKRRLIFAVSLLAIAASPVAFAQNKADKPVAPKAAAAKPAVSKALLPADFAGWTMDGTLKKLATAAEADAANAAALAEYDFTEAVAANYKRGDLTLSVQVQRFKDATGAFGAFTFYRRNNWAKESIGADAGSFHNQVIFWQGNLLVSANFSKIGPMSGSNLRELASQLPVIEGRAALLPPLLANLPKPNLKGQTTHYALGPSGYSSEGVLPAEVVNFGMGAEVVTTDYTLRSGPATLTLIDYPTPQMAAAQEEKIRAYIKAGDQAQPAWTKRLQDSDRASLEVKRSGPIVVLISGDAIPEESHKLIAQVNFDADLTTLPTVGGDTEIGKTGKLLMGIATIVLIGTGAALLLGFFLGGGRALYRIARGKPASSVYDTEFIRLNLRD